MSEMDAVRVLLVEDDEDDYILTRGLFTEMKGPPLKLEWFSAYQHGLEAMLRNQHDVCLVDYRLGVRNGIDLLREALARGCQAPIILLTGLGAHQVDVEAMNAGAADYLVKAGLRADSLERSIRYALERKRAVARAAFEQARLAAFGADIGLVLTQREALPVILHGCADAMMRYLNVELAQIWILDSGDGLLHLQATSGAANGTSRAPNPSTRLKPAAGITGDGKPVLVNKIAGETCVPCHDWAQREGITAYAGYPLMLENRLIGLMSIYSGSALSPAVIQELGSVANGIALSIERKRSETALGASEDKFRLVVESLKEVVFQVNEFGHWTALNPAWREITGFEVKEVLGGLFLEFVHHDDRQRNSHIFLELMERKLDYCRYETRLLTKDGKVRWVEVYAQLTVNPDGSVLGASGSLTDITDRKHAERQIQKLAAFPQVNPNPVLEFDAAGALTYFNDAAQVLANTLGSPHPRDILPGNAADIARQALISTQKKLNVEVALGGRTISWSFFPIVASQVVHCYGVDITEMQSLEAQFRHAQKLESVGQLAAGVAHDFNNILTVITGTIEILAGAVAKEPQLAAITRMIDEAAARGADLTQHLLAFARRQPLQPREVDINTLIIDTAKLLRPTLGEHIEIESVFKDETCFATVDPNHLATAILNLALNSRDAMPQGGKLILETGSAYLDEAYADMHDDVQPGDYALIAVSDTGNGIPSGMLDKVFNPFFTSKGPGKGTGLGLSMVYGFVKQSAGHIKVYSEEGYGTTIKMYLPPGTGVSLVSEAVSVADIEGGHETILVVEDDRLVREYVLTQLRSLGYVTLDAGNAAEALAIVDAGREFDLLFTDVIMPGTMNGRQLADAILKQRPDLRILFTSGYTENAIIHHGRLDSGVLLLAKPYRKSDLARMIRKAIDG